MIKITKAENTTSLKKKLHNKYIFKNNYTIKSILPKYNVCIVLSINSEKSTSKIWSNTCIYFLPYIHYLRINSS